MFRKCLSQRRFKNPDRITWGVIGVWVPFILEYFYFYTLYLKTSNLISPSEYHLIFVSSKGDLSVALV